MVISFVIVTSKCVFVDVSYSDNISDYHVFEGHKSIDILYYLKLRLVLCKHLVSFSEWEISIITQINAGSLINTGSFVGPQ